MPEKSYDDYINHSTLLTNHIVGNLLNPLIGLKELYLDSIFRETLKNHPNPLNRCGEKVFSQNEEDGITLEIISRLNLESGIFAEFGVGNGLENNTILLASLGWRGFWVGGGDLAFDVPYPNEKINFSYLKSWITLDNLDALVHLGKQKIGAQSIDVISLDLDGNDYYFIERLLQGENNTKLFIVEYNPKFPPPLKWKMNYDASHQWKGDDYYGSSLSSLIELFQKHGYFLACCNGCTGSNAFFIHESYKNAFRDIPRDIKLLWSPCRYLARQNGHPLSPRTIELIINNLYAAG